MFPRLIIVVHILGQSSLNQCNGSIIAVHILADRFIIIILGTGLKPLFLVYRLLSPVLVLLTYILH